MLTRQFALARHLSESLWTTDSNERQADSCDELSEWCKDKRDSTALGRGSDARATAAKTIIRCLHSACDKKGTIVRPAGVLTLESCVDVSFTGNCGVEPPESPVSVKSRTGIITFLAGCPLTWRSQIQSSDALSTFQSECVGLSCSVRVLIPLRGLLLEVVDTLGLPPAIASTIHCRVHEDNASALLLEKSQYLNNQNKYLAVKLHPFGLT